MLDVSNKLQKAWAAYKVKHQLESLFLLYVPAEIGDVPNDEQAKTAYLPISDLPTFTAASAASLSLGAAAAATPLTETTTAVSSSSSSTSLAAAAAAAAAASTTTVSTSLASSAPVPSEVIHPFLESDHSRCLLLLGDSGAGKTLFGQFLVDRLWSEQGTNPKFIPLFMPLSVFFSYINDVRKKHLTDDPLTHCLKAAYGLSASECELLKGQQVLLFLDAYDELKEKYKGKNIYVEGELNRWKIKTIITCRTEALARLSLQEQLQLFAPATDQGALSAERWKYHLNQIQRHYIQSFKPAKGHIERYIRQYIIHQVDGSPKVEDELSALVKRYQEDLEKLPGVSELITNPFILQITVRVLPALWERFQEKKRLERYYLTRIEIYREFLKQWYLRQKDKLLAQSKINRDWNIEEDCDLFCRELAGLMWQQGLSSVTYRQEASSQSTPSAQAARRPTIGVKRVLQASAASSMQHADAIGESSKSKQKQHKNWDDFFSPDGFFNGDSKKPLGLVRQCCPLQVENTTYSFFHKSLLEYYASTRMFQSAITKTSLALGLELNNALLTDKRDTIEFIAGQVKDDKELENALWEILEESKHEPRVAIAAANVATILVAANPNALAGKKLNRVRICGADLTGANLEGTQLENADLRDVTFVNAWLGHANLNSANLDRIKCGELASLALQSRIGDALSWGNLSNALWSSSKFYNLFYTSDNKCLIVVTAKTIYLFDVESSRLKNKFGTPHVEWAHGITDFICVTTDGKALLYRGKKDHCIWSYHFETNSSRPIYNLQDKKTGRYRKMSCSPDCKYVVLSEESSVSILSYDDYQRQLERARALLCASTHGLQRNNIIDSIITECDPDDRLIIDEVDRDIRQLKRDSLELQSLSLLYDHERKNVIDSIRPAVLQLDVAGGVSLYGPTGKNFFRSTIVIASLPVILPLLPIILAGEAILAAKDKNKNTPNSASQQTTQDAPDRSSDLEKVYEIKFFNCDTDDFIHSFYSLISTHHSLMFSHDAKLLFIVLPSKVVVWNFLEQSYISTVSVVAQKNSNLEIIHFDSSYDNQLFATRTRDGVVSVWHIISGICMLRYQGSKVEELSGCIAFSPDNKTLAIIEQENSIKFLKLTDMAQSCIFNQKQKPLYPQIQFFPDGKTLLFTQDLTALFYLNLLTQTYQLFFESSSAITKFIISPNGKLLALCLEEDDLVKTARNSREKNFIQLYDIGTRKLLKEVKLGSGSKRFITSLTFSPDNKKVAYISSLQVLIGDLIIHFLDIESDQVETISLDSRTLQTGIIYSPDGKWFVTAGANNHDFFYPAFDIWDVASSAKIREFKHGLKETGIQPGINCNYVSAITFSPDGKYLVSASSKPTLKIWDPLKKICLHNLVGHSETIISLAISSDSKYLLSADSVGEVRIWSLSNFECLTILKTNSTDGLQDIAWVPNMSSYQLAGISNAIVTLWQWDPSQNELRLTWRSQHWPLQSDSARLLGVTGLDTENAALLTQRQARVQSSIKMSEEVIARRAQAIPYNPAFPPCAFFDPSIIILEGEWAVSLVRKKNQSLDWHAFLFLQSVEDGYYRIRRIDFLLKDRSSQPAAQKSLPAISGIATIEVGEKSLFDMETLISECEGKSQGIRSERGQRLLNNIREDQERRIKYFILGKNQMHRFFQPGKPVEQHNCQTWCETQLGQIGVMLLYDRWQNGVLSAPDKSAEAWTGELDNIPTNDPERCSIM